MIIITEPQNPQDTIDNIVVKTISPEWYEVVRQMREDPTFALARAILTSPIIKNGWRVEGEDKKAQEIVEKVLFPLRQTILRQAVLNCVDYGWASWECVPVEYESAKHVFLKTKNLRNEITFVRAKNNGEPFGLRNLDVNLSESRSAFVSANGEYGSPYGFPLMKNGLKTHLKYCRLQHNIQQYADKVAVAQRILKYPVGKVSVDEEGEMLDNSEVAKMIIDKPASAGLCLPVKGNTGLDINMGELNSSDSEWDLSLLESKSSGSDPYLMREKYWDSLKMRSLLIPERVALEGQHGTKAESGEQADIAYLAIEDFGDQIIEGINAKTGFVGRILEYNNIEWYPGRVAVRPLPLSDDEKKFLKEIFRTIVNNDPRAIMLFDINELAKRAGITAISKNYEKIVEEIYISETKGVKNDSEIL